MAKKNEVQNIIVILKVEKEITACGDAGALLQPKQEPRQDEDVNPPQEILVSVEDNHTSSSLSTQGNVKLEDRVEDWIGAPYVDSDPIAEVEVFSGAKSYLERRRGALKRRRGAGRGRGVGRGSTATRGKRKLVQGTRHSPSSMELEMTVSVVKTDLDDEKHSSELNAMDEHGRISGNAENEVEFMEDDSGDEIMPSRRMSKERPPPKQRSAPIFHRRYPKLKSKKDKDEDFDIEAALAEDKAATTPPSGRPILDRKNPELYEVKPTEDGWFHCPLCESRFRTRYNFVKHIDERHVEHECGVCSKKFKNRPRFQAHRDMIHNDGKGKLACPHCESRFYLRRYLQQHIKDLHGETLGKEATRYCNLCDSKFISQAQWMMHRRQNHPDKVFDCGACGTTFTKESKLLSHLKNKHPDDPKLLLKCPHCVQTFPTERLLFYHIDSRHESLSLDVEKPFKCTLIHCTKRFRHAESAAEHSASHEKSFKSWQERQKLKPASDSTEVKAPENDTEGAAVKSLDDEDRFQCPTCGKLINVKDQRQHQEEHQERDHICQICGKKFPASARLTNHITRVHRSFRVKCPFENCQKMVKNIILKSHIEMVHSGIRHQCDLCDKSFSAHHDLLQHVKGTHRGMTVQCSVCGKDFNRTSDRNRHERQVHSFERTKRS